MDVPANTTLNDAVYQIIHDRIIHCVYEPGTLISEKALTQELSVSRTPVRDALNRLGQDGFIRILPKKGVMVKELTISGVSQLFQVREEVEPTVIRLAGPHLPQEKLLDFRRRYERGEHDHEWEHADTELPMDTQLHLLFIQYCQNDMLIDFMHRIFDFNTQLVIYTHNYKKKIYDATHEHLGLIDAVLEGRYDDASALMREHVIHTREAMLMNLVTGLYQGGVTLPPPEKW